MILLEVVYSALKKIARFCIWFITARDCKHCKFGGFCWGSWHCNKGDLQDKAKCLTTLWRCYFKRKKNDFKE